MKPEWIFIRAAVDAMAEAENGMSPKEVTGLANIMALLGDLEES